MRCIGRFQSATLVMLSAIVCMPVRAAAAETASPPTDRAAAKAKSARAVEQGASEPRSAVAEKHVSVSIAAEKHVSVSAAAEKHVSVTSELTWSFGDEDVGRPPAGAANASPAPALGDRLGYDLIGDQLESQRPLQENWVLWSSQAAFRGYVPGVTTRAVLALGFDLDLLQVGRASTRGIEDAGTEVALGYELGAGHHLELAGFPLDSNQLRLGFAYPLTYGGTSSRRGEDSYPRSAGGVPGLRASYRGPELALYAILKTAQIPETVGGDGGPVTGDTSDEDAGAVATKGALATAEIAETNYTLFGGAEWRPVRSVSLGGQGGVFEQGPLPTPGTSSERATTFAAAARVVVFEGVEPDDPLAPRFLTGGFPSELGDVGFGARGQRASGWLVSLEGTELWQRLRSFEGAGSGSRLSPARAIALQGKWLVRRARIGVYSMVREPGFVLRYGPGLVPFQTLPNRTGLQSQVLTALSLGLRLREDQVRPSLQVGLELPASITTRTAEGPRSLLLKHSGESAVLGAGQAVATVVHARLGLTWAASPGLSLFGWLQYRRDPNRQDLVLSELGDYAHVISRSLNSFGFGLTARARF